MPLIPARSYYELLGVSKAADAQDLRKAFYRLSKDLHPDTTSLPVEEAAQKFHAVCEAYALLSDPLKREAYDRKLMEKFNLTSSDNQFALSQDSLMRAKFGNAPRRPFSGGELFSLLLLCIALLISLVLGVGFALVNGKELQVRPSWLTADQSLIAINSQKNRDVVNPSSHNSFKSTFIRSA